MRPGLPARVALLRAVFTLAFVLAAAPRAGLAAAPVSATAVDSVRFTYAAGAPIRGGAVVRRGALYLGSSDGVLHALDAATGALRWRHATGGAIVSRVAVAGALVCFASRDAILRCVDAASGRERWRASLGRDLGTHDYWDYFQSSPVIVGDLLLVGSGDGRVRAFAAASGKVRWTFDAGARIRTTIAVQEGLAVLGAADGRVHALRVRDGALQWTFATEGASHTFADQGNDTTSVVASPTFAGDVLVVGGRDAFLYGLDRATGRQRWRTTHDGSSWILSTAFDGAMVHVGSGSAQIVQAADPSSGAERWRFHTRGAVFAPVVVAGDTVLAADLSGTLLALDRATGALRWQFPLGDRVFAAPLVDAGTVYAASDNGVLFALALDRVAAPGAVAATPRRLVYHEDRATTRGFRWFQNGADAAFTAALLAAGYEAIDRAALLTFLARPATELARCVVVLADNRVPAELRDDDGTAVRRFLAAGGKLVLPGPNPWAYVEDRTSGEVTAIDFTIPARIFDVTFAGLEDVNGYYATQPTAAGRSIGLRSPGVAYAAVDPAQAIEVLVVNEFGKASAWRKSYGGPRGTGLLQLALPRQRVVDYAEYIAAIEHGIGW